MSATSVNADVWQGLIGEAYTSVERLIWEVVNRYHRRYGGDLDELKSTANDGFMTAVYTWDENKGAFTTHVWTQVYYALRNEDNAKYKNGGFVKDRKAAPSKDELTLFQEDGDKGPCLNLANLVERKHFDLHKVLADLSEEAQEVAQVALGLSTDNQPVSEGLLAEIFHEAGWAAAEFLRAFREIGEALL